MPSALTALWVVALAVLHAAPALAETRGRGLDGLEVTADTIEYERDRDVYIAEGNVRLVRDGRSLEADWAVFSGATRRGAASGRVALETGGDLLQAEFLQFDVETLQGVIFDVDLDLGPGSFRIAARRFVRTGDDRYTLRDAVLTTCRCKEGERLPWQLRAGKAKIEVGGYGTSTNTTLEILEVPVLWLPWIAFPVKTERQTGVLIPDILAGGRNGAEVGLPFFWAARKDTNVLLTPRWSQRRGPKWDLDVHSVYGRRSRTRVRGSYAYDLDIEEANGLFDSGNHFEDDRWAVAVDHDQDLPGGIRLRGDVNLASENQHPLDFSDHSMHRADRFLESRVFGFRHFGDSGRFGAMASTQFADDLNAPDDRDRDRYVLQRLPELSATSLSGPLAGLSWLSATFDSEYSHFWRRSDPARLLGTGDSPADDVKARFFDFGADGLPDSRESAAGATGVDGHGDNFATQRNGIFDEGEFSTEEGQRLVLHPRVGVPLRIADLVEARAEVGYEAKLYWSDQRDFEEQGRLTASAELRTTLLGELKLPLVQKLEHRIEPFIGWALSEGRGASDAPIFVPRTGLEQRRVRSLALENLVLDRADQVFDQNRLIVGIDNRLLLPGSARSVGELTLAADIDPERGHLDRILFDVESFAFKGISSRFHMTADPRNERIDGAAGELRYRFGADFYVSARYRFLREIPTVFEDFETEGARFNVFRGSFDDVNQMTLSARAHIWDGLYATARLHQNFGPALRLSTGGSLEYVSRCKCWAVGLEVRENRNRQLQYRVQYTLLGLGDDASNPFAGGRGLGLNDPR